MKQHLTIEDLKSLSDSQKLTINSWWLPAKYDRVVASVCKDAENDIYEDLEFVVGEIILSHGTQITLRRLRLLDEIVEENDETPENKLSSENEELEINFDDPGDYFLRQDCLPLLSIGQLISFLRNTKSGQNGFSIGIPPANDRFSEKGFTLDDRFGEVSKANELTDLLFDMLKTTI